jgi:hypothetical protein
MLICALERISSLKTDIIYYNRIDNVFIKIYIKIPVCASHTSRSLEGDGVVVVEAAGGVGVVEAEGR